MKHEDIWRAVDALAAENGLSASGLAKRAGLDPTTFNKSKRRTADGHERWPGTESVAKILNATGASLEGFTALVTGTRALSPGALQRMVHRRIPLIGFAQAGGDGYFDDGGYPVGGSWDEVSLPEIADPNAYALEIAGDSMEPVFRDGDQVIVSPSSPIRRGDRVIVRTLGGEVMAKQLAKNAMTGNLKAIAFIARIEAERSALSKGAEPLRGNPDVLTPERADEILADYLKLHGRAEGDAADESPEGEDR